MDARPRGVNTWGTVVFGLALPLLSGCGEPTVADRIDGLLRRGNTPQHDTRPSPTRRAELWARRREGAPPRIPELADRLREEADGRAVLDAGGGAVPELTALLDDEGRRVLAAVFLAEIGGKRASAALLKQWRGLRDERLKKKRYVALPAPEGADPQTEHAGFRYTGVEHRFYSEVLYGLSYCGLPVSAAIAGDTRHAMEVSEMLLAEGVSLGVQEHVDATDLCPNGATDAWHIGSVETGTEGLEILAMIGAPEAPALFIRALGSPVRAFRFTAVQNAAWLGDAAESVIPAIGSLLDDPGLAELAVTELAVILGGTRPASTHTDDEVADLVATTKAKLQELGYLPR